MFGWDSEGRVKGVKGCSKLPFILPSRISKMRAEQRQIEERFAAALDT